MPSPIQRLADFIQGLFHSPSREPDFADQRRATEAKLVIRMQEFEDAKRSAALTRDEYERHVVTGDWSEERRQIQLANGNLELRKANLLFRQIKALQENLQTLSTAIMGGEIVADAAVPVEESELEALDRAYFTAQRQRQQTSRAERALAKNLMAEEDSAGAGLNAPLDQIERVQSQRAAIAHSVTE